MTNYQTPKVKNEYTPSPTVGEGDGEGGHTIPSPTLILPHKGGG